MTVYHTEAFKEVIEEKKLQEYAEKHGEDIHLNGTHELMGYSADTDEEWLFLTLDFQDDFKTPVFYVRRMDDDELESHKTFEAALEDFKGRIKKQTTQMK